MKIYYFLFEVVPDEHFKESGGAFVNCWVRSDSKREAERIAVGAIRNDRYAADPEILELYEQAEMEGESYLFNIWPPEPHEEDTIH